MTFSNPVRKNHMPTMLHNYPVRHENKVFSSPSTKPAPKLQVPNSEEGFLFDEFWKEVKAAAIADDNGWVFEEIAKKHPLDSFNADETRCWFNLITRPVQAKFGITYAILEFYAFLIVVGPKVGIKITSTNMTGGGVPSEFLSYYIRTCNNLHREQAASRVSQQNVACCVSQQEDLSKNHRQKNKLISDRMGLELRRKAPDIDLVTGIEGDLLVANHLVTQFFAWKLSNVKDYVEYDLGTAIREVLCFANQFSKESISPELEYKIRQSFYNDYMESSDSDFTLASFGPADFRIDHNFFHEKNIGRCLFPCHGLVVPYYHPVTKIIEIVRTTSLPLHAIQEMNLIPQITPKQEFCGGLQSILDFAGRRIRVISKVKRGWGGYITHKTNGYDGSQPNLHDQLCSEIKKELLPLFKKRWENHHHKKLSILITLGFNTLISLPEDAVHQDWWKELMLWYDAEVKELEKNQNAIPEADVSPFLKSLKAALDSKTIPFSICRDLLQMYGCLTLSCPQNGDLPRVRLSNPEADWHEVNISQKIDKTVHAIFIPLNLHQAIENILKLTDSQLGACSDLLQYFYPRTTYDKKLIPTGLFDEKLANCALECLAHSHKTLNKLGYDLLLLYALSNPQPWALKNIIKHLPVILDDQLAMANLENVLNGFPDTIETHRIISPLKSFCQSNKAGSKNGCYEFCLALTDTDHSATAVRLSSGLKMNANEQMKFIKALLFKEPLEAAKLFDCLQSGNSLSDKDEISLFVAISEIAKKNEQAPSYASQLIALASCVKRLFRKQRMESLLRPTFDPIIKIVDSLISSGQVQEALELLVICSGQQLTLVNANKDTEVWLNVCEAALSHSKIDIENLHEKWAKRFTVKFNDQKLAGRKTLLEIEFKKRIYEKNRDLLIALQKSLQESGQKDNIEKIMQQIDTRNANIIKLLINPELLECALEFLEKMSSVAPTQGHIDLAINVALECAKSCQKDADKLRGLDKILRNYLNAIKDPGKEYKVRQASLQIADALLLHKLPDEAIKWMQRIFRIATPNNLSRIDPEEELFGPSETPLALISLNLPKKPSKVLAVLSILPKPELEIFKKLIDQLPHAPPIEIAIRQTSEERTFLIKQAREFLKHVHPIVNRIGFELIACCTGIINQSNEIDIDLLLLNDLINYLPIILSVSGPIVRGRLLDRMKSLLQASSYAEYSQEYLSQILNVQEQKLSLYQANCKGLAKTQHLPLCKIGQSLISKEGFDKFAKEFSLQERSKIALSFVKELLPANVLFALETLLMIEKDLNPASCASERKEVFILLIDALTEAQFLDKAIEQLSNCTKNKILLNQDIKTRELWLNLLRKAIHDQHQDAKATAKLWLGLLETGSLPKNYRPEIQIDLMLVLIGRLYELKSESSNIQANQLITHFIDFKPNETQKANLLLLIENNLKENLSKEKLSMGYQELKSRSGLQLSENVRLDLKKSYLKASIKFKDDNLAIEILIHLQNQAEEEFVSHAFDELCDILSSCNSENIDEEVKLKQYYQLLKNVDLKCLRTSKFQHALKWLKSSDKNDRSGYDAERLFLLKWLLQTIESGLQCDDYLLEVADYLLKSLKSIKNNRQPIPNDLKELIVSCHPKIAHKLQSTVYLDKYCEYLNALNQHQISLKISDIVLAQTLWVIAEYLKCNITDPVKWQEIHHLLLAFTSSKIDISITSNLATSLLTNKLPLLAIKWIDYTIANMDAEHFPLESDLYKWCNLLLEQNEPQLCISPLTALKSIQCQPSILAETSLNVSKALLNINIGRSAELMINNWNLLEKNCPSIEDLNTHLKDLVRKVFTSNQVIDVLFLFKSLMACYKSQELDFTLEQLKTCCGYIDTLPKGSNPDEHTAKILNTITITFFNGYPINSHSLQIRYRLIQELIESQKRELLCLGVAQLNIQLADYLFLLIERIPKSWLPLCKKAIETWFLVSKDAQYSSEELVEIDRVITNYAKIIGLMPSKEFPELEKGLTLFFLQYMFFQDGEDADTTFGHFVVMLNNYGADTRWVEKCVPLLVDTMINRFIKSNAYLPFLECFTVLTQKIDEVSPSSAVYFLKQFSRKCITIPLKDSMMRSLLLYHTGISLESIIIYYKNKYRNLHIFDDKLPTLLSSKEKNEISDLIELIGVYFFCLPGLDRDCKLVLGTVDLNQIKKAQLKTKSEHLRHLFLNDAPISDGCKMIDLTGSYFIKNYQSIEASLHKWGFHKAFPKTALTFKLVAYDCLEGDIPNVIFKTDSAVVFDVFSSVINRLLEDKVSVSTAKALVILKSIPQFVWAKYPEEFTGLIIKVMNNDISSDNCILHFYDLLEHLHNLTKNNPEWINLSTEIYFHLMEKILTNISPHDLKSGDVICFRLLQACTFLITALDQKRIKENEQRFVPYFKTLIQHLAMLKPLRSERSTIGKIIEVFYDYFPKYRTELNAVITQYFNQLIVLKPEYFRNNVKISFVLNQKAYIDKGSILYENHLRKFVEHFEHSLVKETSQDPHCHTPTLDYLILQLLSLRDKFLANHLMDNLHKIIDKHISKLILIKNDPNVLAKSIEVFLRLDETQYFDGRRAEFAEEYKQLFIGMFNELVAVNNVTSALLKNINKLLSNDLREDLFKRIDEYGCKIFPKKPDPNLLEKGINIFLLIKAMKYYRNERAKYEEENKQLFIKYFNELHTENNVTSSLIKKMNDLLTDEEKAKYLLHPI